VPNHIPNSDLDRDAASGARGPLSFRPRHRLAHANQFRAVYDAKVKKVRGPLIIYTAPNDLPHPRLGLSVGRAVGTAVKRNRVKRLLREAFRHLQYTLPTRGTGSYDLVVNVRPHTLLAHEAYRDLLADATGSLHREWERRARRKSGADGPPAAGPPAEPSS
jgi:ribonuclease P protein component